MGNRSGWVAWALAVLLVVVSLFVWNQLQDCKAERDRLSNDLDQCRKDVEATQTDLDTCNADLAKCRPGPPGPIIDISPTPNSGGNYVSIGGVASNPVAPSGSTLNAKAFGEILEFEAELVINGQTVTRNLNSAKVKFGNKTLEISRGADGKFNWVLDGTPLSAAATASEIDWRNDICCSVPTIEVDYMIPGGGSGTASGLSVRIKAQNP